MQLTECLAGRLCHLALHGQQLFLAFAQRVLFESNNALQQQPVRLQLFRARERLHSAGRNRQDLGPNVAGRLPGKRGHVLKSRDHALIMAVGLVLGGLQKRVNADPLAHSIHVAIEP